MTADPRDPGPERDLERLLAEAPFVRALARELAFGDADDVEQQAWLNTLQRPAAEIAEPRRWLARVVRRVASNLRRSSRRRDEHERQAPLPDLVPTSAELMEREERRRELVAAVDALPPSLRTVVLLRWFEGLPPREIAVRLGLPASTVSTLLRRAIVTLRARYEARGDADERRAWLLPLCGVRGPGWLDPMTSPAVPALTAGVLAMAMKSKLLVVAALLLVAASAVVVWPSWTREPARPPGGVEAREVAAADAGSGDAAITSNAIAEDVVDAGVRREAAADVAAAADDDAHGLRVEVVWASDQTPAVGVDVVLYSRASRPYSVPRLRTDVAGVATFGGIAPARYHAAVDRGTTTFGVPVEVVAGRLATTRIEVPVGLTASGRVIDERGAAVADADIVAADWGGGRTCWLGRSAADGGFSLRGVATSCHIGARKRGHAPSSMRSFNTEPGAQVEFTIVLEHGGARLTGAVFGPDGAPVGGAAVRVGPRQQNNHVLPDGGSAMGPQPEEVRTDAAGRFAVDCVLPGAQPIAVCAAGLAPWEEPREFVAGQVTDVVVHLQRGASLAGVVRDAAGAPVPEVELRIAGYDEYTGARTQSRADGSFAIDGLPVGVLEVVADSDDRGRAGTTLEFSPGVEQRWEPVLSKGLVLRGRLLDHLGEPVKIAHVEASLDPWRPGDRWSGWAHFGHEGHFEISNCPPGRTLQLVIRRKGSFPELTLDRVAITDEELLVRMPEPGWVFAEGSVRGPAGELLASVEISPHLRDHGGSPVETVDPSTGAFTLGPYPPGHYTISFSADGLPRLRVEHTFTPGERLQLGELRFVRGGRLALQLVGERLGEPGWRADVWRVDGARHGSVQLQQGGGRSEPLAPGDYQLMVKGPGGQAVVPFAVREDVETRLDVPVVSGAPVTLAFAVSGTDERFRGSVAFTVRDAAGQLAWRGSTFVHDSNVQAELRLPPGEYRVEAAWHELAGAGALQVAAGADAAPAAASITLAPR